MGFYFHNKSKLNRVVSCDKYTEAPSNLEIFLWGEGEIVNNARFAFCDFI